MFNKRGQGAGGREQGLFGWRLPVAAVNVQAPLSSRGRSGRRLADIVIQAFFFMIWGMFFSAFLSVSGSDAGTITDDMGRKITITAPFTRIISLYPGHTENLFSLGLDAEIIGVSSSETYPEKALSKPVFSYHDDLEKFMAARPTLVLIRPMIDRGYARLLAGLEKNGITVISLQPGNIDEIYLYWRMLGTLTGKETEAARQVADFKKSLDAIHHRVQDIHAKKTVYFEAIHDRMKTFSPDSMAIFAVETAGGINLAKDAEPVRGTNIAAYGKEKILSHAGNMDVYLAQSGPMNRVTIDMIQNESGFSAIKAVQNRQIYLIDEVLVSRPTVRLLEGIRTIAKILYPDHFTTHQESGTRTLGLLLPPAPCSLPPFFPEVSH
jgi:iron complex transport system substrate-binding protein